MDDAEQTARQKILNGAMWAFGESGYKKASMADVAAKSGVSKALVFHHFESKKNLYAIAVRFCMDLMVQSVSGIQEWETDFFMRMKQYQKAKQAVLQTHPHMYRFLKSVYCETDPEVQEPCQISRGKVDFDWQSWFTGIDQSYLKEGVDLQMMVNVYIWCAEGIMESVPTESVATEGGDNLDALYREIDRYSEVLRRCFYKGQP